MSGIANLLAMLVSAAIQQEGSAFVGVVKGILDLPDLTPLDRTILSQLAEVGPEAAPAVYDRYSLEQLQEHHNNMVAKAQALHADGHPGMAMSLAAMHDLVCPYLAVKNGLDLDEDEDETEVVLLRSDMPSRGNPQDN